MTVYTLPELPYDYAALEPHISGTIMELHHDKHHANYVGGANTPLRSSKQRANPATSPPSTCTRRTLHSTSVATPTTPSSGRT